MAGYQDKLDELKAMDASVFAASVDPLDKAEEVAADLDYPLGYGVTRSDADAMGAWWEERRGIVQPSEFVLNADGKVMVSTYCSGPVGRMHAEDAVRFVAFQEKQRQNG